MGKFCGMCGTPVDEVSGKCPKCEPMEAPAVSAAVEETGFKVTAPIIEEKAVEDISFEEETVVKKGRNKVLVTIISVFLSIILFVVSFAILTSATVHTVISKNTIEKTLDDIDFTQLTDEVNDSASAAIDSEELCKSIGHFLETEVSEKQLDKYFDESSTKEFLTEKISDYAVSLYSTNADFSITEKEIKKHIEENRDVIDEEFEVSVTDEQIEKMAAWLADEDLIEEISPQGLMESSPAIYYALRIGLSYFALAFMAILFVLLVVLMIKNSFSQAACGVGIILVILGAIAGGATLAVYMLPSLLEGMVGSFLISNLFSIVLSTSGLIFGIVFAAGVLILVIRKIVLVSLAKKKEKAN